MPFDCPVCLEVKSTGNKCYTCSSKVCFKCLSKMLKVCRLGCPCYRWRCPSCRAKNCSVYIKQKNSDILLGIINDFQRIASEDLEDEDNI